MKLGVIFQGKIIFHNFFLQHMVPVMVEVAELKIISSKIHGWNMNQTPQLRFFGCGCGCGSSYHQAINLTS